jgi:hypothetical protein
MSHAYYRHDEIYGYGIQYRILSWKAAFSHALWKVDICFGLSNCLVDTQKWRETSSTYCRDMQTQLNYLLMESDVHGNRSRDQTGKLYMCEDDCSKSGSGTVE